MGLSAKHASLLAERGIDPELAAKLGVTSFDRPGGEWIKIPYLKDGIEVNAKYRTIAGEKRFSQEANAVKCLWNVDVLADSTLAGEPLIITEGEFDALIALQAGFSRVVSVPDGAPAQEVGDKAESAKYSYLDDAKDALRDVREIILCTDGDGPGANLLNDLALRLGKVRCKWVKYPRECKDLNDAWKRYGERGVKETIARAQFIRVEGVYRMSDLPPVRTQRPVEIGIAGLERHYRVRLGDFCVITGIPGHGKSTFIDELCGRLALNPGWGTAFASFERRPQVDHRRNLRTFLNGKRVIDQTDAEIECADEWIDKRFSFIVPSEDDDVTLPWLLERAAAAVVQHGARIVVVDPWNEMDHIRPADMSLTEYTGFGIKQFRKFAKKYDVHVIVAAHPTKQRKNEDGVLQMPTLYDISDSAHWYNKADVGVVIHRLDKTRTIIRVAKSRYHDEIGEPGEIVGLFNPDQARYQIIPEDIDTWYGKAAQ